MVGHAAGLATDGDASGGAAAPFADEFDGALGEDVGNGGRFDVMGGKAFAGDFDVGEDGTADVVAEAFGQSGGFTGVEDDERFTFSGLGQAFDEPAVDGTADAEGEEVGAVEFFADQLEGFLFDGDVAVGDENEVAGNIFLARHGEGALEGGEEFGAAAGLGLVKKAVGAREVCLGGGEGGGGEKVAGAREEEDVEGVGRAHAVDEIAQEGLGGVDGKAAHAATDIEDEEVVPGRNLRRSGAGRRLEVEEEKVFSVRIGVLMQQKTAGDLFVGELVAEHKIAIGMAGVSIEGDSGEVRTVVLNDRLVAGTGEGLQRQAGVEGEVERKTCGTGDAFRKVGIVNPGFFSGAGAGVAGTDNGGIDELIDAFAGFEFLTVVQDDVNFVAGQDVGDAHLEDVGPVLFQKGGGFVFGFCFFEGGFGCGFLLDFGFDEALADAHFNAVNRRAVGGGEGVEGFDGGGASVGVALFNGDVSNDPGESGLHLSGFEGEGFGAGIGAENLEGRREGLIRSVIPKRVGLWDGVEKGAGKQQQQGGDESGWECSRLHGMNGLTSPCWRTGLKG